MNDLDAARRAINRIVRQGICQGCYRKGFDAWLDCGALGLLCNDCFEDAYASIRRP